MKHVADGPASRHFSPVDFKGNITASGLRRCRDISSLMAERSPLAPQGACVCWGLPFRIDRPLLVTDRTVEIVLDAPQARWLVVMHCADLYELPRDHHRRPISPMRGEGGLGVEAARYGFVYEDGTIQWSSVRRRHEIGAFAKRWGENCFAAVAHQKPFPVPGNAGEPGYDPDQFNTYMRASPADGQAWKYWLWAWENPRPDCRVTALRVMPGDGPLVIAALSAGNCGDNPLRWRPRRKALMTLPKGKIFNPALSDKGLLEQVRLDMGQVISAQAQPIYPTDRWSRGYNNGLPRISDRRIILEYTSHEQAAFHLAGGRTIPVDRVEAGAAGPRIESIARADRRVKVVVRQAGSSRPVAAKLHIHGTAGEYLPPEHIHRLPNPRWYEDWSVDFTHRGIHHCCYIDGEAWVRLPMGRVYLEVSKGFELRPVRKVVHVRRTTDEIVVEIDRVLDWRARGWVSADTHVHFLSPTTARLEGAGEGVNVINLLASQWGELMTNVGDFDGKTTHGEKVFGGDGEYLVRVGTENRQHVLGHISLLGYRGEMITPMTTGGPDESALGDPVESLLTEWAIRCRRQGGLVVLPHFPNPRGEGAATIVSGEADAVEMTAWGDLYSGIDPYSLADWYRYLNCGYQVAAVGGTDKMTAMTAVGAVRTYARIATGSEFNYAAWMEAVRRGETFVTYGPLMDFDVDGRPAGSRIAMGASGGTVEVCWRLASCTIPMSRVEMIVNGEVVQGKALRKWSDEGVFRLKLDRSSWLALLVRGHYADKPEMICAHSSAVFVEVAGTDFSAAADALTILDQIEGAMAYLDTVGIRPEDKRLKQMRLLLSGAHRSMHNRMHAMGVYHNHGPATDHSDHHGG